MCICLLLISAHALHSNYNKVSKLHDIVLMFVFNLGLVLYSCYRCYYHVYLSGNIFVFFLFCKLVYVFYRNFRSLAEFEAAIVYSLEEAKVKRLIIQKYLVHFNSQVCFTYIQLGIMQSYFLLSIIISSYHHNSIIAITSPSFIKEINFLLLTICLCLAFKILSLVWSTDLCNVNSSPFGDLLLLLGLLPIFYFTAVSFCAMSFTAYHVIVGVLVFLVGSCSSIILEYRLQYQEGPITFLAPYKDFVSFLQSSFLLLILVCTHFSGYVDTALVGYLNRFFDSPGGELSIQLFNLLYFESYVYLQFLNQFQMTIFIFIIVMLIAFFWGVRAYFVFLRTYLLDCYEVERFTLYWHFTLVAYLVGVLVLVY